MKDGILDQDLNKKSNRASFILALASNIVFFTILLVAVIMNADHIQPPNKHFVAENQYKSELRAS